MASWPSHFWALSRKSDTLAWRRKGCWPNPAANLDHPKGILARGPRACSPNPNILYFTYKTTLVLINVTLLNVTTDIGGKGGHCEKSVDMEQAQR
jgi:hypothetical protein